jgi:hypothetical protein
MITIDRDIYIVLLGGIIGFVSSMGTSILNHLLSVRLIIVKVDAIGIAR